MPTESSKIRLVPVCLLLPYLFVGIARANRAGANSDACGDMTPQHGRNTPQTSASPYSVTVSRTTYAAGITIDVTVSSSTSTQFKGFLIQARKTIVNSTVPVGTFSNPPANTQLKTCGNADNSFTHSNGDAKTSVTVTWNPPAQDEGNLEMWATVVQSYSMFWTHMKSDVISFHTASGAGNETVTATGEPTSSTEPSASNSPTPAAETTQGKTTGAASSHRFQGLLLVVATGFLKNVVI